MATNIAETSITIDDIVYVIDSGRAKENRYDALNRLPQLVDTWVATANRRQRRGRAGRVQPGEAFYMYTSQRHTRSSPPPVLSVPSAPPRKPRHCVRGRYTRERSDGMAPFQLAEMLRVPLHEPEPHAMLQSQCSRCAAHR